MSARPSWRLLETGARPAPWNMACDATLFARLGAGTSPPTVRFYEWDPPAVSIGHHQAAPEPAAVAALAARGASWVRRPTGGRAVWHGPPGAELTYAIVAPLDRPPLPAAARGAFRRIHEALAEGLSRLGAEVRLAPARRSPPGPRSRRACFAASAGGEIEAAAGKLVGSAQRSARGALLQHGSIPLSGGQSALLEAWPGCLPPGRATTLAAVLGRPVEPAAVRAALVDALAERLEVRLEPGALAPDEAAAIDALAAAGGAIDAPLGSVEAPLRALDGPLRARRYSGSPRP